MPQNPTDTINSFKDNSLKWLIGICVSLVVFIQLSSYKKIDNLDAKFDLLLSQTNKNTTDIEVLKIKLLNLENTHSSNNNFIDSNVITLFKPEDEIKYKPRTNEKS
jgi:low affinity Fe/Cu permease